MNPAPRSEKRALHPSTRQGWTRFQFTLLVALLFAVPWNTGCGTGRPKSLEEREQPGKLDAASTSGGEAAGKESDPSHIPVQVGELAKSVLGPDARVLEWGDLAGTGTDQIFAARMMPGGSFAAGKAAILQALIVESEQGKWREIFRADEHLKNPLGYLIGTPSQGATGWQLHYVKTSGRGLEMRFTPMAGAEEKSGPAIAVRWNPAVGRYQSFQQGTGRFLGESPRLGNIIRDLRR